MHQAPACPTCASPLRWFAELQQWGCDRCRVMVPVVKQPPQARAARSRRPLWLGVGALALVGGGVAMAVILTSHGDATPEHAATTSPKLDAGTPPPVAVKTAPPAPPPTLGKAEATDAADVWLWPRSDGSYLVASRVFEAVFPSRPSIQVTRSPSPTSDGKVFDVYRFDVEQGKTAALHFEVVAAGTDAKDSGALALMRKQVEKVGKLTETKRDDHGQEVVELAATNPAGQLLRIDSRIDVKRGLFTNANAASVPTSRELGNRFLASVHLRPAIDPVDDAQTLTGVRIRKVGKKLVAHDKTDLFTVELPWPAKVTRTVDPANHEVKVVITATKKKATIAIDIAQRSPWDGLALGPTGVAAASDLLEKELGKPHVKVTRSEKPLAGLPATRFDTVAAHRKTQVWQVWNRYQERLYRVSCADAPCDTVTKSFHFADPEPLP